MLKISKHGFAFCTMLVSSTFYPASLMAHAPDTELLARYSQRISRHPEDFKTLINRAEIYLRHDHTELAYRDILGVADISDETEAAHVLGLYHIAKNDHESAVAAFSKYLPRYPGHIPTIHYRARSYSLLGRTDQSISDYEYLLRISKKHSPDYYLEMARVYSSVNSGGIELALESLDRGMQELGVLVSLQNTAIQYETGRGNFRMAMMRHETLKPWLGKTSSWQLRKKSLARQLMAKFNQTAPNEAPPRQ